MEVSMAEPVTVRLSDEVLAKISSEAEQKECSVSHILREKIEWAYALEDIKEMKEKLEKLEALISEIAPQTRRAEILSWWSLIMFTEYIKCELSAEKLRNIENKVDEKYKDYLQTRELKF